jgi:hypothetical protein
MAPTGCRRPRFGIAVTRGAFVIDRGEVREMTLIGIVVVVVALIVGATLLALGMCASSAARDEVQSGLELPSKEEAGHPRRPQREVRPRLASVGAKAFVPR